MALVGLVRVSTDRQETRRQHDALDAVGCVKVFEEKISGKLRTDERPALTAAIDYMRSGDMLTVQEADRLGRNLLEGLLTLSDLFEQGVAVKILDGIAKGEHTERSFLLDLALALAEDRRRDIVKKTNNGLDAARRRGVQLGRRQVMTDALVTQAVALRDKGYSLRQIQPHLWYRLQDGERRNPSTGAISEALKAYDEAQGDGATPAPTEKPRRGRRTKARPAAPAAEVALEETAGPDGKWPGQLAVPVAAEVEQGGVA